MQPIRPSNWKAQRRVLCTLLLGVTALWAMPSSIWAQLLYVGQNNTVGEYNASTGAPINANFITGLSGPGGLALSGNDTALFVATGTIGGKVGKYDATTGAAINAKFIAGLSNPVGLAVAGNDLFVGVFPVRNPLEHLLPPGEAFGTVSKYDATMGVAINTSFITGLHDSPLLAVAPTATPTPTVKELVWENTVTGEHSIWVLDNGEPANVISLPTSPIQWRIADAADSPDSAQADLVWENTVTGEHTIWILNSGAPLSSTKLPTISTEWQIVN